MTIIKQLLKQSTRLYDRLGNNIPFAQPEIELFSELLIRECIKECINEIHVADVGDLVGKSYYLDLVAEHIEKHFGIK